MNDAPEVDVSSSSGSGVGRRACVWRLCGASRSLRQMDAVLVALGADSRVIAVDFDVGEP